MNGKEIAKFFSGLAANQVLTHGAFAAGGVEFRLFGIDYTTGFNTAAAVVWSLILALLVYHAWMRQRA